MTISIIIPVYQAERFIKKAVQSACGHEEVIEIILVEDGSVDDSLKICKNLVNHNNSLVKLFQHPDRQNHGAGASRNFGIKKAKGEFIAFLDADDYYLPDRFKRDLEILQINQSVDGVYNALGWHVYDEAERGRISQDLTTVKYQIPPENLFEEMAPLGNAGYFSCDTLTVRREIFDKVGLFNTTLELSQDTHMWIKMAAKASLVSGVIDRPVAMRGVHAGNRVKDKVKFDYYRPLLFASLLKWANDNSLSSTRKRLLWDCLNRFYGEFVHSQPGSMLNKKVKMFLFLVEHGFLNPHLLVHRSYRVAFFKLLSI